MATVAQITANRLNALRSTGPRSEEGKAASRFNALKSGVDATSLVIPGEDPAELDALALDYRQSLRPAGPLEEFLVATLVTADWTRRRYARIEAQLVTALAAAQDPQEANPLGAALVADAAHGNALHKVHRRLDAAERGFFRALNELRRLQSDRMEAAMNRALAEERAEPIDELAGAEASPQEWAAAAVAIPRIGFVPPHPAVCVDSAPQPADAPARSLPDAPPASRR